MTAALMAAFLIAQSPSAQLIDSAQVHRVQKALAEAPALETTRAIDSDRPVFRLKVHGPLPGPPPWSERTSVPPYVRPSYPVYHWEFLQQVTPEAHRAATLYPGMDIMPLLKAAVFTAPNAELKRRREASARKEVRDALEDLARARAAATK